MARPSNPLLDQGFDARFDEIRPEHVGPATDTALRELDEAVLRIATASGARDYPGTVAALDAARERVEHVVGWTHHLLGVASDDALQQAFEAAEAKTSAALAELDMHEGLYRAVAALEGAADLRPVERRRLEELLRDFRRLGVALPADEKARVRALRTRLSELATRFERQVLDATNAFALRVEDEARLAGIPEWAVALARGAADARGESGWVFTLQQPSYLAVVRHARDRALRRALHEAKATLAAAPPHDNRALVREFLAARRDLARALGYAHIADLNTEDRMAKTGRRALDFVLELTERTRPFFERDVAAIEAGAAELGLDRLEPWDVAWVIERLRRERVGFDEEALRPYLPLPRVLDGLFEIVRRVLGLEITPAEPPHAWHRSVRYFEVREESGSRLGAFYADFFPRETKRSGAWMAQLWVGGPPLDGAGPRAPHLGFLGGNFTPAADAARAPLLSLDDVLTLAHELGHCLHLLTSEVPVPALAGTNVAWDFIELPSQLLENWVWEREAFDLIAAHHETGARVPDALFDAMTADRRFMAGYYQMRQLAFGRVDLELHMQYEPDTGADPFDFARALLESYSIRPDFAEPLMLCSFRHLFGNGYDAGYYSYKWAEVLEADIFARFKREGIFNRAVGRELVDTLLARGDAEDPDRLFRAFMGRDPDPAPLFERTFGQEALV